MTDTSAPDHEAQNCVFVTVVRDHEMYRRLVKCNSNNAGGTFVAYDNSLENRNITTRYNSFLDSWDYSSKAWFVFLHEDYEFLEPIGRILAGVDKRCIYGTVGAKTTRPGDDILWALNSNRDGSSLKLFGRPFQGQPLVLTSDCNCMIVHSDLVRSFGLRFDEKLSFDLYVEDFEINAFEKHGIETRIIGILNHHYSYGHIAHRFYVQRRYLRQKYSEASRVYGTTTKQLIGPSRLVLQAIRANRCYRRMQGLRRLLHFFWYLKYSRDGYVRVRFLGVVLKFRAAGRYARYIFAQQELRRR